jgi:hypothetical protein
VVFCGTVINLQVTIKGGGILDQFCDYQPLRTNSAPRFTSERIQYSYSTLPYPVVCVRAVCVVRTL